MPDPAQELDRHIRRLRRQQAAVFELARNLAVPDEASLFTLVTELGAQTLHVQRVSVWLLDDTRQELTCWDLFDRDTGEHTHGDVLRAESCPAYFQALESGRALDAHDAADDPRTDELRDGYLKPLGITSMLDAAIRRDGRVVGVVCHEHIGPPRTWTPDEVSFAADMADQVALRLEAAERRRAEEARQNVETRFARLGDAPHVVIWTADAQEFSFTWVSKLGAERLLGYPASDWLDDPEFWPKHIHPDDRDGAVDFCVRSTARLQSHDFVYRMVRADGRVIWVHDVVQVIVDDGKARELIGLLLDVTAAKEAEEQRERLLAQETAARKAAEDAVKAREEFMSIASHELRTPLTSLNLAIQNLLDLNHSRSLTPELTNAGLATADRQVRRLTRLVHNLLDVSRMRAGELELELQEVDIERVVRDVVEDMARGQEVEVVSYGPLLGTWDPSRLEQVVTNLVSNALKYGRGEPVRVEVARVDGKARLTVADRGIGIPEEARGSIFEAFRRLENDESQAGMGLGLYVVKQIVGALQGAVSLNSEVGRGTTVQIDLPLNLDSEVVP